MVRRKRDVMMMMMKDNKGKKIKIKNGGIEKIYFLHGKEKFKISHGGPCHPFCKGGWTSRLC